MSTLGLAFRSFFKIFGDQDFAERVKALLTDDASAEDKTLPGETAAPRIEDQRNAAISLVAALQREARFLDFVMEPLDDYDDAQVGAAVRDIQRDLGQVVERVFAPQPLRDEAEGNRVTVPAGFDPALYRLTGEVSGEPPYDGTLRHHGWKASKCEVPAWTGSDDSAMALAPSEVEV